MALKTEMTRDRSDGDIFPIFNGSGDAMQAFEHDAMYAHALSQAVNELATDAAPYWLNGGLSGETKSWLLQRADELMAEWLGKNNEVTNVSGN